MMMGRAVSVVLGLLIVAGTAGAQGVFEAETLEIVQLSGGSADVQNVVEADVAAVGEFAGDTILHWHDGEPGAILELKVPVWEAGQYEITVCVAKSWDYGIHQLMVNGQDVGRAVDLYYADETGATRTVPLVLELGEHRLAAGEMVLGVRVVGTNPEADPVTYGAGIDWVKLEPAGGEPAPTPTPPAPVRDYVGAWLDETSGALTLVSEDGTWIMMSTTREGVTPRAGTWGRRGRSGLTFRTCLSATTQLWNPALPEETARKLVEGPFDLTMVWDLRRQGEKLVGTLRAGRPTWDEEGQITDFKSWDEASNEPIRVTWRPVPRPVPGQELQPELRSLLEKLPPEPGLGALRDFRDWLTSPALGELGEH